MRRVMEKQKVVNPKERRYKAQELFLDHGFALIQINTHVLEPEVELALYMRENPHSHEMPEFAELETHFKILGGRNIYSASVQVPYAEILGDLTQYFNEIICEIKAGNYHLYDTY